MSERCPARDVTTILAEFYGEINETSIPDECLDCLNKARASETAQIETTDTFESGLAYAREYIDSPNFPAEEFDRWNAVSMKMPKLGLARTVIEASGFDLGLFDGESYYPSSETQTISTQFECSIEQRTYADKSSTMTSILEKVDFSGSLALDVMQKHESEDGATYYTTSGPLVQN